MATLNDYALRLAKRLAREPKSARLSRIAAIIALEIDPLIGAARPAPGEDSSDVDHPQHYGGADNPYEAIKVIDAWGLGFCLGNVVKYISRAGRKNDAPILQDLEKARWYLDHEIKLRGGQSWKP